MSNTSSPQQTPDKPTPKTAKWRRWLIEGGIILAIFLAIHAWQHKDVTQGVAPNISGINLAGETVTLSDFQGQPLLVHFFAPWCPVCKANHSNIIHISQHYPVLMVVVQTEDNELNQWLADHPEDRQLPMVLDPKGEWLHAFGAKALPTNVFVDAQGNISTTELGYITTLGLWSRFLLM